MSVTENSLVNCNAGIGSAASHCDSMYRDIKPARMNQAFIFAASMALPDTLYADRLF